MTYTVLFMMVVNCCFASAQGEFYFRDNVSEKIYFQFVNNLIIIPLEINNVTLSFLLDTGVSRPILFNLSERDSLDLKNTQAFYLNGLGSDGEVKTLKSK
jgi:hypothetical protein